MNVRRRYDSLLIDADETLFDFETGKSRAIRATLAAAGLPATDAEEALFTRVNEELWRALERGEIHSGQLRVLRFERLLSLLTPQWEAARTASAQRMSDDFIEALSRQSDLLPGALDFMRQMAGRCPLALVTNGIDTVQRRRLAASPLARAFDAVLISGEVGSAKPHPLIFDLALLRLSHSAPRERALMIGDSLSSDIRGGLRAGLHTCWLNAKGAPMPESGAPHYAVPTLAQALTACALAD